VRGFEKVRAVVLWYALTNNILQGHRLAAHKGELARPKLAARRVKALSLATAEAYRASSSRCQLPSQAAKNWKNRHRLSG